MTVYRVDTTDEGERLRLHLCDFLEANGIDPYDIPRWSEVKVTGLTIEADVYKKTLTGEIRWQDRGPVTVRKSWRRTSDAPAP